MSQAIHELARAETMDFIVKHGLNKVEGEVPEVWPLFIVATTRTWIGVFDDKLACMWGVMPPTLLSERCYLWLVTTPVIKGNEFRFIRHSQRVVEEILELYPEITGECRIGADRSIRWLKWLGATFGQPQDLYVPFTIKAKHG